MLVDPVRICVLGNMDLGSRVVVTRKEEGTLKRKGTLLWLGDWGPVSNMHWTVLGGTAIETYLPSTTPFPFHRYQMLKKCHIAVFDVYPAPL